MKPNKNKYPEVTTLPKNALTVKEFAAKKDTTTSNIYMAIKRGTADFKIVVFKTINFIIPN